MSNKNENGENNKRNKDNFLLHNLQTTVNKPIDLSKLTGKDKDNKK